MSAREADYQATIVQTATLAGWYCHAERPATTANGTRTHIQGHAGWPDLCLVRGTRALFLELKRRPGGRVTAGQVSWQERLIAAGLDARVVWLPDELDALLAELTERAR